MKKHFNIETLGSKLYYIYRLLKLSIFMFNLFIIYKYFFDKPILITLSIVLNIIYIILYINRLYLNIVAGIFIYLASNNIVLSVALGLSIGNNISYIIDFLFIKLISLISRIANSWYFIIVGEINSGLTITLHLTFDIRMI